MGQPGQSALMPLQPLPQVTVPAAPTWSLAWGGDGTNTVQREEDRAIKPITVPARNILCAARVRPWQAAAFIHLNTVEQRLWPQDWPVPPP